MVAEALQVGRDLERRDDVAEIDRHRLAERQQADDERADLLLERVDRRVALDDRVGGFRVAPQDALDRAVELRLDEAAHAADQGVELRELLVVGLHDVFAWLRHVPSPLSRTGR